MTQPHERVRRLVAPLAGGLVTLFAFAGILVPALHSPSPQDLPVGVVAPPRAEERIQTTLTERVPGAIDLRTYASEGQARDALLEHEVTGVFLPSSTSSPRLLVASAQGNGPADFLAGVFGGFAEAQGTTLAVEDLAPLPDNDRQGVTVFLATVALTIGGLIFQVSSYVLSRRSGGAVVAGSVVCFAVLAGLTTALTVDTMTGALTGHFWEIAGLGALFALAVTGATAALTYLVGLAGAPLAAVLLLPLGIATSGGQVNFHFLPDFYAAISQYLPTGASVSALRRVVYFDGAAVAETITTIAVWALAGWAIAALVGWLRVRQDRRHEPARHHEKVAG